MKQEIREELAYAAYLARRVQETVRGSCLDGLVWSDLVSLLKTLDDVLRKLGGFMPDDFPLLDVIEGRENRHHSCPLRAT